MQKIKKADIVDEILVCPYCMNEVSRNKLVCCGESCCHFEKAYVLTDGELVLESEIEFEKE